MGKGQFTTRDGAYGKQTSLSFFKKLYYEMRQRSILSKLAGKTVDGTSGQEFSLDSSNIIDRNLIQTGDTVTKTLQEHIAGMPTYGDMPVNNGDFIAYKNIDARINNIDTMAIPVQGKMQQQLVAASITDLPGAVQNEVTEFLAKQEEYEFLISLFAGASPSVLKAANKGGLAMKLGFNALGAAGAPLACRNIYTTGRTGYANGGMIPMTDATPSVWNAAVNTAIGQMTTNTTDKIDRSWLKKIRKQLDRLKFAPVTVGKTKYKAVVLCDDDVYSRIAGIIEDVAAPGATKTDDNPQVTGFDKLFWRDLLFICVPDLNTFRPATGTGAPKWGPVTETDPMSVDPRTFANGSNTGVMVFLGGGAVIEGYKDEIEVTTDIGIHKKGVSVAGHIMKGFVRTEWNAYDGRPATDAKAVQNFSSLIVLSYEPGDA